MVCAFSLAYFNSSVFKKCRNISWFFYIFSGSILWIWLGNRVIYVSPIPCSMVHHPSPYLHRYAFQDTNLVNLQLISGHWPNSTSRIRRHLILSLMIQQLVSVKLMSINPCHSESSTFKFSFIWTLHGQSYEYAHLHCKRISPLLLAWLPNWITEFRVICFVISFLLFSQCPLLFGYIIWIFLLLSLCPSSISFMIQ